MKPWEIVRGQGGRTVYHNRTIRPGRLRLTVESNSSLHGPWVWSVYENKPGPWQPWRRTARGSAGSWQQARREAEYAGIHSRKR
jgi:hypothetical protein